MLLAGRALSLSLCAVGVSGLPPLPVSRVVMAAASRSTSAAAAAGVMPDLATRADHSWITQLQPDPEAAQHAPNKSSRQVTSGHYVPVLPTPLPDPRLLILSPAMTAELGLDAAACREDAGFTQFFSGDLAAGPGFESWCTPYALSIMGQRYTNNCPFGNGNGYGDGRAVSIGEVVVPVDARREGAEPGDDVRRWELQLKGGGRTPFCRGADGRAVLRSSIREFLASEAMHNLGVPTTRALSLIVSGQERSQRPWYSGEDKANITEDDPRLAQIPQFMRKQLIAQLQQGNQDPDVMVSEKCAITCRVSPSFTRVGHVDLFARRAFTERRTQDGPLRRQLNAMVAHAIFREFPDLLETPPAAAAAADAATEVPFLSKDVTMAFLDRAADGIARLMAEWLRVGFAQGNFNADNCLVGGRTMDYGPFGFMEKYDPAFAKWTGSGDHFAYFNQPQAGFANWNVLAESCLPVLEAGGGSNKDLDTARTKAVAKFRTAVNACWRRKLGFAPAADEDEGDHVSQALFSELERLMRKFDVDFTITWRQLAHVVDLAQGQGGANQGWNSSDLDDAALVASLEFAFNQQAEFEQDQTKALWATWLRRWLAALQAEAQDPAQVARNMRLANPKYVPREWMLVEAYSAAADDDMSMVHELFDLFASPYDERTPELEAKYYRRDPKEKRAGTAFMT